MIWTSVLEMYVWTIADGADELFDQSVGPASDLRPFLELLRAESIFAREVDTWGSAYHSPALADAIPGLTAGKARVWTVFSPLPLKRKVKP
jgi:hypothetical protein